MENLQSIYAEPLRQAMKSLHLKFPEALQLHPAEVRLEEDMRIGRRYGYLGPATDMLSSDPVLGSDRRKYSLTRGAFDGNAFIFPFVIATAYATKVDAFVESAVEQLNIRHRVATLNKLVDCDGVYLKPLSVGDLHALYTQSTKPPHPWIAKITGELVLPLSVYKSPEYGEHQRPPDVGEWIQAP